MKLKTYKPENTPSVKRQRARTPFVRTTTKGLILINKMASERIGLRNDHEKIVILQDEEEPENFYIEVLGIESDGFVVRETKQNGFVFNSKGLVKQMNGAEQNTNYIVAGVPTKIGNRTLWGLIPKPSID